MSLNGLVYRLVRLLLLVGVFNAVSAVIKGNTDNQHYQQQVPGEHFSKDFYRQDFKNGLSSTYTRFKPVTDCMFITADPGSFIYSSKTDSDEVCGIYFLAGPDQKIEINFLTFDVPCEHRGLISVVDGWELNGEVFPSEMDHRLPLKQRISEFCGKNIGVKRSFTSSQNAAVIRYRIPKPGKGFTLFARFLKNPRPCNVLAASLSEPYTLRNYGRRVNCTYVALYPGTVQVIALGVGVSNFLGSSRTAETGTLRKCDETSPQDQVIIGGSDGLDTSEVRVVDSICGIDSKPDYHEVVKYGVTSVRLISSGFFENSVTVEVLPLKNELLDANFSI
ncbi:corticotropin-releasing factor-binding protein isoform X1 [Frieseomelitta varia]|uniref:corticotropin-releasing factor-binding protein isoform X1 n=1 Tax=Frieseomelitta varia TaxID=561572 RepID=UPI001CB6957E|nr:corticotropin-releasing factor-binding protein isoform X1 [Frieseomelitta varia]